MPSMLESVVVRARKQTASCPVSPQGQGLRCDLQYRVDLMGILLLLVRLGGHRFIGQRGRGVHNSQDAISQLCYSFFRYMIICLPPQRSFVHSTDFYHSFTPTLSSGKKRRSTGQCSSAVSGETNIRPTSHLFFTDQFIHSFFA